MFFCTYEDVLFMMNFISCKYYDIEAYFYFFSTTVYAQNKQKRSKGFINLRDINQELLLAIPELLQRLVKIAINKDCKYSMFSLLF